MQRDYVSQFVLVKFKTPEYTQDKRRIWEKGCFDF